MPTLGLQGAQWSDGTPSVEWTGGPHCRGVTTTKTRMWREEAEGVVEEGGSEEEEGA